MHSIQLRSRLPLCCCILVAFGALAGIALRAGRVSNPPARASVSTQPPAPAGIVSHSAHFTLTAEIHAGS